MTVCPTLWSAVAIELFGVLMRSPIAWESVRRRHEGRPTFVFVAAAVLALYMCFATIWGWRPTVRSARIVPGAPAEPARGVPPAGPVAVDSDADATQLAIDINDFLNDRQVSAHFGTRRYDAETVHAYHQRFATRLVRLGNDLMAAGTLPERVSMLLDRQTSVEQIGQVARYLKYREWRNVPGASDVGPVT
jgi:hypothetical protein